MVSLAMMADDAGTAIDDLFRDPRPIIRSMIQPGIQRGSGSPAHQIGEQAIGPDHTPYDAIGGEASVRALVDAFYDTMHGEPAYAGIRALHKPDLADARQKLFEFLCGWLGGPELYVAKYGHPKLRARHMPFSIGDSERDQWLACMKSAMDQRSISQPLRAFLEARFVHVANFMRNKEET